MAWSAPPWRPADCARSGHSEKDAGVIGETVDPAEFADSLLDHRTDLGPVRNVAFDSQDTAPNRRLLARHRISRRPPAARAGRSACRWLPAPLSVEHRRRSTPPWPGNQDVPDSAATGQ